MDLRDPHFNMDAGPSNDVAHVHDMDDYSLLTLLMGKYVSIESIGDQECQCRTCMVLCIR